MSRKKRVTKSAQKVIDIINLNLTLRTDEALLVKSFYSLSALVVVYGEKRDSKYMYKILKELDEVLYDAEIVDEKKVNILLSAITYEHPGYRAIIETLLEFLYKLSIDDLDRKAKSIFYRNTKRMLDTLEKLDI